MAEIVIDYILCYLNFSWLTGPVFDKELRVSSRRRRNYILRFAYISLLLTILLLIWILAVDYRGSNVLQVSRMAQAGKYIITYIVWFQFCAAQIIAVVMLSNSISDEIYHKTLGMLMTTPITSMQIVIGKLLSKLLQLLLLLAISMPLLAIVRMFGGVPWSFITSSMCLTLTTVLLVSSLSLFYSIFFRRAYIVIIMTILTLLVFFGLVPFIYVSIITLTKLYNTVPEGTLLFILIQPNPYLCFFAETMTMMSPGSMGSSFFVLYKLNCILMLIISLLLIFLSIIMVRKVALRQATGQLFSSRQKEAIKEELRVSGTNSSVISVFGPPILWKELILPLRRSVKIYRIIIAILFLSVLFYSYWFFYKEEALDDDDIHAIYALVFMGLGALFTIVISSVSITSEKESRSWPLLLTSTLTDSQIVIGKLYGILSRCLPVWLLLIGHVLSFTVIGFIHPVAVPLTILLVVWFVFLICSSGMYFSSIFKHTTTAVIMNFVFIVFIWGFIPLVFGIMGEFSGDREVSNICFFVNPFIQILVIIFSTIITRIHLRNGNMEYSWPNGWESADVSLFAFCISFCIYMILALFLLWRAKKRLRSKIF
ncbi:MAG: ABC transporter permease subunit [Sedimentisphaerales bacterium]|nr:ABC transporter permease subunit [Sedimentisphaerales bacterium]